MEESIVVLITGPNRGIGRRLLETFLARENHTVIAAVRDPSNAASKALLDSKSGAKSNLVIVKIDSTSLTDASTAIKDLEIKHGIPRIDIVIANAGIAKHYGPAITTPVNELHDHLIANALAPFALFQAAAPLLQLSQNPKFFVISSNLASLALMEHIPMPGLAYGCSKAAVNYVCRKIHFECPWLTAVALSPGWVQTDMGQYCADALGAAEAPVTLDESVGGLLKQIDRASRSTTSGEFISFDESPLLW